MTDNNYNPYYTITNPNYDKMLKVLEEKGESLSTYADKYNISREAVRKRFLRWGTFCPEEAEMKKMKEKHSGHHVKNRLDKYKNRANINLLDTYNTNQ
tara:strand:- start:1357 stop:1650 length:294 start_codon:yes stop_codon:yes gene_type:complete